MNIDAILWDYDGTLVNSVSKNIAITKQILSIVAPRLTQHNLPKYLKSEKSYHLANHQSKNWQDLYLNYYGMTETEMNDAGALWTAFQLKDTTPVELFPEIKSTICKISLPQGICSQNSSENINFVLEKNNLSQKLNVIIGYDDIPSGKQKPSAFGGIKCLNEIYGTPKNKTIIYVGDHEQDVEFARNLEMELCPNCKVVSVVVTYSGADTKSWTYQPDFEIDKPSALIEIINNNT